MHWSVGLRRGKTLSSMFQTADLSRMLGLHVTSCCSNPLFISFTIRQVNNIFKKMKSHPCRQSLFRGRQNTLLIFMEQSKFVMNDLESLIFATTFNLQSPDVVGITFSILS